jgi:hypothetical protein
MVRRHERAAPDDAEPVIGRAFARPVGIAGRIMRAGYRPLLRRAHSANEFLDIGKQFEQPAKSQLGITKYIKISTVGLGGMAELCRAAKEIRANYSPVRSSNRLHVRAKHSCSKARRSSPIGCSSRTPRGKDHAGRESARLGVARSSFSGNWLMFARRCMPHGLGFDDWAICRDNNSCHRRSILCRTSSGKAGSSITRLQHQERLETKTNGRS